MILVKDQIEYTNPDGEKLIGQVVSKSEQDVLECNLLYPTKTKQPGEKFFVNADDKMVKKAEIKRQPYDKHKSQYSFNKESMEIIKEEENILKLGLKKLSTLDKKYSDYISNLEWSENLNGMSFEDYESQYLHKKFHVLVPERGRDKDVGYIDYGVGEVIAILWPSGKGVGGYAPKALVKFLESGKEEEFRFNALKPLDNNEVKLKLEREKLSILDKKYSS